MEGSQDDLPVRTPAIIVNNILLSFPSSPYNLDTTTIQKNEAKTFPADVLVLKSQSVAIPLTVTLSQGGKNVPRLHPW